MEQFRRTLCSTYLHHWCLLSANEVESSHKTNEKSAQRIRKHCALAVVRRSQKFSPRRRLLSEGAGRPKFNQLEMVTTFTYRPSLVKIDHAISSYRVTDQQTNKQTNRVDYNTLRRSLACSVKMLRHILIYLSHDVSDTVRTKPTLLGKFLYSELVSRQSVAFTYILVTIYKNILQ